jgi:hypothetical protein
MKPLPTRVATIVACVSVETKIPVDVIRGRYKGVATSLARKIYWLMINRFCPLLTCSATARLLERDHSTIHYALSDIRKRCASDAALVETIERIATAIETALSANAIVKPVPFTPTRSVILKGKPTQHDALMERQGRLSRGYIDERGNIICGVA